MVKLAGGVLSIGSTLDFSEKPVHQVAVLPFAISRTPVTIGEWRACLAAKSCLYEPSGEDDMPVNNVSWDDAQQYVAWLSQTTSKPYRLPNEAEWEYAARAGSASAYWWGAQLIPGSANCKGCGGAYDGSRPVKVGSYKPNRYGLFDMGGNVEEWVSDCWHSNYHGAPRTGSWEAPNCREHVLRGGSWKSEPDDIRVSARSHYDSGVRYPTHGFRVAVSQP
jgi:formylglycine-generating enzyme required for sulfatase activity